MKQHHGGKENGRTERGKNMAFENDIFIKQKSEKLWKLISELLFGIIFILPFPNTLS